MKKSKASVLTTTSPLPLPKRREVRLVQAEVDKSLFDAVKSEMKAMKAEGDKKKICEIVSWGLKSFLAIRNPKALAKLDVK